MRAFGLTIRSCFSALAAEARHFRLELRPLLRMLAVMGLATLASLGLHYLFEENGNVSVIYTLAVMIVACVTPGYIYSIMASLLGVLGVNYFFMWPYLAFNFTRTGYPFTFILLFSISFITSSLMSTYRSQAEQARRNERRTHSLYCMTNELLSAQDVAQVTAIVERWVSRVSGYPTRFLPPGAQPPEEPCFLMPLEAEGQVRGMLAVLDGGRLGADEATASFLRLFAAQWSLAAENLHLSSERNRVALEMESEKLRANLLRAVSHDLRTPLTSISGAASALIETGETLPFSARRQLYEDIRDSSQWLIRMVENLLSVTRFSQDAPSIKKTPEMAEEVLAQAVSHVRHRFPGQAIQSQAPQELLIVPMEATLIQQALINLMENAIYHSGAAGPIAVEVARCGDQAIFTVRDHGKGIDPARVERLFDGHIAQEEPPGDTRRGMGLGLSICASIVRAHGGSISAHNAPDGGAVFRFCLPLDQAALPGPGQKD